MMSSRKKNFKEVVLGVPFIYKIFSQGIGKPSTIPNFVSEFVRPKTQSWILDVGCGDGRIRKFLGDVRYVGVDHNKKYIETAKKSNSPTDEFHVADVSELEKLLVARKFDRILLIGVLHHLSNAQCRDLLSTCARLLATDGHLVTLDPAFIKDQHPVARLLAKLDRGKFARSLEDYHTLIEESFASVAINVRHDLLRIPYTHAIYVARNNPAEL